MDGMGMLMKSLGIDPEQLKDAATQVQTVARDFQARLERIESKQDFLYVILMNGVEYAKTIPQHQNPFIRMATYAGSDTQHRAG